MRLVTAESRCRSSMRRSMALIVRQAGQQRTHAGVARRHSLRVAPLSSCVYRYVLASARGKGSTMPDYSRSHSGAWLYRRSGCWIRPPPGAQFSPSLRLSTILRLRRPHHPMGILRLHLRRSLRHCRPHTTAITRHPHDGIPGTAARRITRCKGASVGHIEATETALNDCL